LADDNNMEKSTKHWHCNYEYSQAKAAVWKDYPCPYPLFDNKQFQQIFVESANQSSYKMIRSAVQLHPFFNKDNIDCCGGQETIGLDVKLLIALKVNAYGIAANAFCNYFQMGESMAHNKCCECFNEAITQSKELTGIFLRKMTKADAQRVTKLHFLKHGIHGMLGCLDCMHVAWKNCPVVLQGAFTGKEGMPTLVLGAMSDDHLWIWHLQLLAWLAL